MDIETAQAHLNAWLEADLMLATAKSWEIETPSGRRRVSRADAAEIRKQIAYWRMEINKLQGKKRIRHSLANLQDYD